MKQYDAAAYQKRMDELDGDPSRDPFTDGCGEKALFRLVSTETGVCRCVWFRNDEIAAARGDLKPFKVVRGEPTEILAPRGWRVAAFIHVATGQHVAIPFAEVPRPEEIH